MTAKPRFRDRGEGITFLVKVEKDAPWCTQIPTKEDKGSKGPATMETWEGAQLAASGTADL